MFQYIWWNDNPFENVFRDWVKRVSWSDRSREQLEAASTGVTYQDTIYHPQSPQPMDVGAVTWAKVSALRKPSTLTQ